MLEGYKYYDLVLTVPSVKKDSVIKTINTLLNAYGHFNCKLVELTERAGISEYFVCNENDFPKVEVSFYNGLYCPHLHCLLKFKKDVSFKYDQFNKFSFGFGFERGFSLFEVLTQKLWYLLINSKSYEDIDSVEIGYSCSMSSLDD